MQSQNKKRFLESGYKVQNTDDRVKIKQAQVCYKLRPWTFPNKKIFIKYYNNSYIFGYCDSSHSI